MEPSVLLELVELPGAATAVMGFRWDMEMEVGGQRRGESPGAGAAGCP